MDNLKVQHIFSIKSKWYLHVLYWLFATVLMFFVFSNRSYDLQIRIVLVCFLIAVSILVTRFINSYLIPKYLFAGRLFIFLYASFALFIITLWLIMLSIMLIVTYSAYYLPNLIIPNQNDIIILLTGNYLVIIMAAVIHFVRESYRRLIEKNSIEKQKQLTEVKLKEANLKLLQGQIHPHFLFNMLNNLYGLVKDDVNTSREVIVKLSDLLDYMLYECDKPEVSLQQEIHFIENYIELERIRHDENFNVRMSYPEIDQEVTIAPLMLFPIVENAFKHGFNDPVNNYIDIKVNLSGDNLTFEVTNSVSEQRNDKYLKQEGKGIGLKNIKERLNLIYKERCDLKIAESSEQFKVTLNLKLHESAK